MDTCKSYSALDHIPYDKFEYIESVDANKGTATVVRDMDAVMNYIGAESYLCGHTYRYEKKLTEIPRYMLAKYLKGLMGEQQILAEKTRMNNEKITKLNEVLAE